MPELLAARDAFLQEYLRCGELDSGLQDGRVWMACECGAQIVQLAEPPLLRALLRGIAASARLGVH